MPEHALMQSRTSDPTYQGKRRARRNDLVPIPHRWFEVVALHLAGKPTKEILEITGYSLGAYYSIMANPRTQAVRQQLLETYQDEFEALFCKVITNIRDQLDSSDMRAKQTAQQQWFSAENKFKFIRNRKQVDASAEDIVSKMLNLNVQVNVASGGEAALSKTPVTVREAQNQLIE